MKTVFFAVVFGIMMVLGFTNQGGMKGKTLLPPGGTPELCGVTLQNGDIIQECTSGGFGNCPYAMNLVVKVMKEAKDHFGLSLGQMIQEYHACRCVITYLGGNWWRVSVGGTDIDVFLPTL